MVSRLGLLSRILLASSFVIIVLALIRLGVNWVVIEHQVMKKILLDSRQLAQQAHIVLKQSAQIHAQYVEKLGEKEQLISQNISSLKSITPSTIPIHFAQEVAQQGLKSEHYDFQIIRENTSNQAVLNQLREKGFPDAYIHTHIDQDNSVLYRVRVGKVPKDKAEDRAFELRRLNFIDSVQITRI